MAVCYLLFFLLSLLAGQLLLNRREDVAGSMPPPITSPLGGHPITRLFHRTKYALLLFILFAKLHLLVELAVNQLF